MCSSDLFPSHDNAGLLCARADINYQQGLTRMWSRQGRFDFYWPVLAHLGEQAVLNKEIYAQGTADDDGVFGYQERYAEYRYAPSQITGKFRSTYAQSLDSWHLGQKFDNLPKLNPEFIVDNPPIDRVVAVPSEPQFLLDCWFNLNCVRPIPAYRDWETDRKSTRLNSSHITRSRMPSSA